MNCVYLNVFVAVGEDGRVHLRLRTAHSFFFNFFFVFLSVSLSSGHRLFYTHGLCDQFYRMSSTISDHSGNCAKCVRFCCNCSKKRRPSRALHDHVNVVDLGLGSCELNARTCCSCSSMDRLATGCSHGQCAQFLNYKMQTQNQ